VDDVNEEDDCRLRRMVPRLSEPPSNRGLTDDGVDEDAPGGNGDG